MGTTTKHHSNSKKAMTEAAIAQRSAENAIKIRTSALLSQCIRTFPELRIGQLLENLISPDYTLYNIPDVILEQRMRQYLRDFGHGTTLIQRNDR